jgi:pimeloyl-ACP methyl ester carboxylesterase
MPHMSINDVELYYEAQGSGPPLVLVHGSWDNLAVWQQVAERLAERYRVISYDRRGHTRSGCPSGPRTRRQDEDDLAALITALAGEAAYVAANSFGGVISLGLAARRPELVRALAVHEPPALGAADGELAELAHSTLSTLEEVLDEIESGAQERATRRFIEEIAIGPGAWELCPAEFRAGLVANAGAFLAEQRDPEAIALDFGGVRRSGCRMLLTKGDQSPLWLRLLLDRLGELLPLAAKTTIAGAGHVPHETNPAEYADVIDAFFRQRAAVAA